eukprot:g610.t1
MYLKTSIILSALCAAGALAADPTPAATCTTEPAKSSAWCDHTKDVDTRVKALVAALTDDEKSGLFVNGAAAVPRLNIPKYNWWSEALHGVARDGVGTSFPQIIGVSSSFNTTLFHELGVLTGTEARGKNNGVGFGDGQMYHGLTMWAPNINIFRDPRWGRGQETPGEDPGLNAQWAEQYVSGIQGDEQSNGYLRASACLKHYAAYSEEQGRNSFPAVVNAQDMQDTYLPAFEAGVKKGHASGLMCSYNAETYGSGVFGPGPESQHGAIPSCANKGLLNDLVRDQWGFNGYITSDCGAVGNVKNQHHYTNTTEDTVKAVLAAGMDSDCGGFMSASAMGKIIKDKEVDAALIDGALAHLFKTQMRLGFFDPPSLNPFAALGQEVVDTPAHRALAKEAADQSIVLLKNENNALPLDAAKIKTIAMAGRNAKAKKNMQGNYFGDAPFLVTPADGIANYSIAVTSACDDEKDTCDDKDVAAAAKNAAAADATVIVTGLTSEGADDGGADEAEGHDRSSLLLPGNQNDVVSAVAKAAKGPVVLVIMSGGPVDVSQFRDSADVDAIVWCGYPGQSGGQALADALFGTTNPSGKLTQTWYPEAFTKKVDILDMGMRPNATSGNPGRSYRFYTGGDEVYKFGAGMGYSAMTHALRVEGAASTVAGRAAAATVAVSNTGTVDGDEIVLLFGAPPAAGHDGAPVQQLLAFARVHVRAGETETVRLYVDADKFAFADAQGELRAAAGDWQLWTGVRSADTKTVAFRL